MIKLSHLIGFIVLDLMVVILGTGIALKLTGVI